MRSSLGGRMIFNQAFHSWWNLRANASPIGQAILCKPHCLLWLSSRWVEITNALNKIRVATVALIGCNNAVKRAFFWTATCQSNDDQTYSLKSVVKTGWIQPSENGGKSWTLTDTMISRKPYILDEKQPLIHPWQMKTSRQSANSHKISIKTMG